MNCVLIGNYGVGNFGDEAICEYFLTRYPTVQWQVLSANPSSKQLPRLPLGVRSFFKPWWRTLYAYYTADYIVFGGGTLFTDIESIRACILWWWHAVPAIILRKPIVLAFQGSGPFKSKLGSWLSAQVYTRASFISVRDPDSLTRIQTWPLRCQPILTVDPVVLMVEPVAFKIPEQPIIGIIPRHNSGSDFLQTVEQILQSKNWHKVLLISFHYSSASEQVVLKVLSVLRPDAQVINVQTLNDAITAISSCSQVLSHRFHGSIIAGCLGVPLTVCTQQKKDKHSRVQEMLADIVTARMQAKVGEQALQAVLSA